MEQINILGKKAKAVCNKLAMKTTKEKNTALEYIALELENSVDYIVSQNQIDIQKAEENGISPVMIDRLMINESRVQAMADGVRFVKKLDDPIGTVLGGKTLENGLNLKKVSVPLGVIGIIFESRPNVTVDAASLCLKSSNVSILRGGKEAINTNKALVQIMRTALKKSGFEEDFVLLIEDTQRSSAIEMMKLNKYIDVLIPRGGAGLIKTVVENATVPVIETGTGNCHVYVDCEANIDMAVSIVNNAKTSRPSVCNACESMLVHSSVADEFLPMIYDKMQEHNVKFLGCEKTIKILGENKVNIATDEDYNTEFLDYIISVKVVDSVEEACEHINKYTTHHSECIVTDNLLHANYFTQVIDAAAVYVNASTRFTDGGEFGLGAEIGISTQKLHARGPMGLNELTSIKYIIVGDGQIR